MYIVKSENVFLLSENEKGAVAVLSAAIIEENGKETILEQTKPLTYEDEGLRVTDSLYDKGNGLFLVMRMLENVGSKKRILKSIFEVETCFVPKKYLIPCVLYDGNRWGSSNTPTGLTYEGKPWIFAYDREGIPSCTLSENKNLGLALFASDCDEKSLRSSCSIIKNEQGTFKHRIYHPVTEAPCTYSGKNSISERYDEYLTLLPGESFTAKMYIYVCVPKWENYAYANLLDRVLDVFTFKKQPCLSPEKVWELGIDYANQLIYDYHGHKMIITHFAPRIYNIQHSGKLSSKEMSQLLNDPENSVLGRFDERFEMGWADQGMLNAEMLAVHANKTGNKELIETAVGIFDSWADKQQENGLMYTEFQQYYNEKKMAI